MPGWFKCRLFEASEGRRPAGEQAMRAGYAEAGEALAENIHRVLDRETIADLQRRRRDLVRWTCENLNPFFSLIPARKRQVFMEGFERGLIREGHLFPNIRKEASARKSVVVYDSEAWVSL